MIIPLKIECYIMDRVGYDSEKNHLLKKYYIKQKEREISYEKE